MRKEVKSKIVFSRVILRDKVYGNCRAPGGCLQGRAFTQQI